MVSRRALLRWLGAGAVAIGARPLSRYVERPAHAATSGARPRFYLQIIPAGGMDPVWGTDPKTRKDVEKGIDVPYEASKIVDAKTARLAPGMASLARFMPRMAVVNAFRQNSANHPSGLIHTTCCRNNATLGMPTLLDLIGARRQSEAIGAVSIGSVFSMGWSPRYVGQPSVAGNGREPGLFDHLDKADPGELGELAAILDKQAASTQRTSASASTTADNIRDSAAMLRRWGMSPKFVAEQWPTKLEPGYKDGIALQRALWMFEHGIARCATVNVGSQEFDTHLWNFMQPDLIGYLSDLIGRVLEQLDARKVDGRPMSEQTVIFVGSEIGRFPRLNAASGKDHFPQVPYLFFGPWFRGGATYGGTDRQMVSLPVSLATGKPDRAGHQLTLDDLGRTLLDLEGINPEVYGYVGERLSFLMA